MRQLCNLIFCLFITFHAYGQEYKVLGIGDPIIDLIYHVDESLLERLDIQKGGSLKIDFNTFSLLLKSLPKEPIIVPGGSCSNMMKGLAKLGRKTAFLGKVGKDEMADKFSNSLQGYEIISLLISCEKNTSQVASLVTPDGQRTMRCCLGAANDLKAYEIPENIFKNIQHLHMDGYMLYNTEVALTSARLAKKEGATVSIDLASFEVVNRFKKTILDLLEDSVDVVFANEDEARALTGLNPEEACAALKNLCKVAVILVGKDGCWVGSEDKVMHAPTTPLHVVDSTGAGDLFASGFLHGYLSGLPLETCAHYGNLTGGVCVITEGAELPEESWQQVREQMGLNSTYPLNPPQLQFRL